MTLTADVPADVAGELEAETTAAGLSLPEYAVRLLVARHTPARTGAEIIARWEAAGVIGSRPDSTDSSAHARTLRATVERRPAE